MDKQTNKLKNNQYYKTGKKSLFLGGIVVALIAATPYLFYLYENFPKDSQFWEIFGFKFKTNFTSFNSFAWYIFGKAIPLYLLLIWFFTCKHWWHWIILIPIAMYAFQLWGVINESGNYDELELYYVFPLMAVLIPFVYIIRAKLFDKIRGDDLEAFERELGQKRNLWQQITDLFR